MGLVMWGCGRSAGGKERKRNAPLFCVLLRLYRLVSPVHGRHLHLFQMLQTQSPAVASRWGSESRDWIEIQK